jgi:GTP pyrophosphokinase
MITAFDAGPCRDRATGGPLQERRATMKTTQTRIHPSDPGVLRAREQLAALAVTAPAAAGAVQRGLDIAAIVESLEAEPALVVGAMLWPAVVAGALAPEQAEAWFGAEPAAIAADLRRIGEFHSGAQWASDRQLNVTQAETLRKMLLAVITDPRLVLVRLASQLHDLRLARDLPEEEAHRLALETREVFAPLANRLGIWQLKWELEDLAFRYLQPVDYKRIAQALAERRMDREDYIRRFMDELQQALAAAGIAAEIAGRPKHIYSIWRKMQRKQLPFERVFDVRAVRILTDSVAACYAALGVVHGAWPFIPGEFDDYIATPKDNNYRSLHTAVTGPGGMPVEVQIRTREMHEHAELGVAAHWRYKEGRARDAAYDRKIEWLRELLAPAAAGEPDRDYLDRVRSDLFEDRVYVLTPRGEVVDLPRDATPLDFAYHLHTDLGHRCRGAKVNGRMVPLDTKLANGQVVEIVTAKQPQPSRDWLVEQQGYLASARSRAKVRAWFKKQDEGRNRQEGRELLERELARLGIQATIGLPDLLRELKAANVEDLHLALGAGDVTIAQVTGAVQRLQRAAVADTAGAARETRRGTTATRAAPGGLTIEGVGDLLTTFARCCSPVPPEPIAGYITLGRGVTVHRASCANLARLRARQPARVLAVDWGSDEDRRFPAELQIEAYDRRGLVRDITALLAEEKVNIERMNTLTRRPENIADLTIGISVQSLDEIARLITRIRTLPNVISARRATRT